VLDGVVLERDALAAIAAAEFTGGEAERHAERARVTTGPAAAVDWLINPFLLADDLPGVDAREAAQSVVALDEAGLPIKKSPRFRSTLRRVQLQQ
jgi:hypothetical protein